jgi:hypothetical protein
MIDVESRRVDREDGRDPQHRVAGGLALVPGDQDQWVADDESLLQARPELVGRQRTEEAEIAAQFLAGLGPEQQEIVKVVYTGLPDLYGRTRHPSLLDDSGEPR